jgi:Protein of unknown function VcgC/VcgE (DUF2780)
MRWRMMGVLLLTFGVALSAQAPAPDLSKTANPELIGLLTTEVGVTPAQAEGGAGALLGLAKSRLKPEEFAEVSTAVPGTDALLKAAPAMTSGGAAMGLAGAGGLASLAGSFSKLGLKPDSAAKFAPVLLKYVNGKGASGAASLLTRAFK